MTDDNHLRKIMSPMFTTSNKFKLRTMRRIITSLIVFTFSSLSLVSVYGNYPSSQKEINVMTYNIHHCNPPAQRGVIDIDAIASVITDYNADIVLLQEVDVNTLRSGMTDQAKELSVRTGLSYYLFYKAIDFSGGDYGVAILSRYPLSDGKLYMLPVKPAEEQRVMGTAVVTIDQKRILIASTHLDLNEHYRNKQILMIDSILQREPYPLVIGGDFNAQPDSREMQIMYKKYTPSEYGFNPTFPNTEPKKHIDYLFLLNRDNRGFHLSFKGHKVIRGVDASDHLPVIATVVIK